MNRMNYKKNDTNTNHFFFRVNQYVKEREASPLTPLQWRGEKSGIIFCCATLLSLWRWLILCDQGA